MLNFKYWRIFCEVIYLFAQVFIVLSPSRISQEVSTKQNHFWTGSRLIEIPIWSILAAMTYGVLFLRHVTSNKTYDFCMFSKFVNFAKIGTNIDSTYITVQITFIFIGQTHLVFGKRVCTCVTKHSNAFRTFLNWLKNSKRVWHQPKLHILRLPLFANFDLWSVSVGWV